ncbi:MAG: hypothetical protein EA417_14405 [Gammaproteobacteria bacterium]|nr:MAG: hypothetical protein EA417_14405 [Gammaproteobacteria bacterium]
MLDREAEVAVTLREPREFTDLALERYTHIVLPDGDYTAVGSALAERLALWVRAGGILVGVKRGALWAVDVGLTEAAHAASSSELDENPEIIRADYVDKEALEALDRTAGAILTADIDTSHPLGAGLASRELPLYRSGTLTLPNAADRFAAVVAWTDRPPIAGLLADSQRERLPGTPALLAERHGAGSVILFSDNPDHRGYWHGSQRLMFNVLYLGASFLAPGQRFAD